MYQSMYRTSLPSIEVELKLLDGSEGYAVYTNLESIMVRDRIADTCIDRLYLVVNNTCLAIGIRTFDSYDDEKHVASVSLFEKGVGIIRTKLMGKPIVVKSARKALVHTLLGAFYCRCRDFYESMYEACTLNLMIQPDITPADLDNSPEYLSDISNYLVDIYESGHMERFLFEYDECLKPNLGTYRQYAYDGVTTSCLNEPEGFRISYQGRMMCNPTVMDTSDIPTKAYTERMVRILRAVANLGITDLHFTTILPHCSNATYSGRYTDRIGDLRNITATLADRLICILCEWYMLRHPTRLNEGVNVGLRINNGSTVIFGITDRADLYEKYDLCVGLVLSQSLFN